MTIDRYELQREARANLDVIEANLGRVRSAPWRFCRNGRLLEQNRELFRANERLLAELRAS